MPASRVLKDNEEGRAKQGMVKSVQKAASGKAKDDKTTKDKQEKDKASERGGASGVNSSRKDNVVAGSNRDSHRAGKKRPRDVAFDSVSTTFCNIVSSILIS